MNKTWLNRQGNRTCILFFNGWGMDENAVNHLECGNIDVCMLNQYNPVSSLDESYSNYEYIFLIAWSLGVWAAGNALHQSGIKLTKSIALNGTQIPIDAENGINPELYMATLEGWNERNRNKFNMRILGGREQYQQLNDRLSNRTIDNQKDELAAILQQSTKKKNIELKFDSALIGKNDLIFTPNNQAHYWKNRSRFIETNAPHYPFALFETWNQIIEL